MPSVPGARAHTATETAAVGYYDIEGDGYTKLGARYYNDHGHFTQPDPNPEQMQDPLSTLGYGSSPPMTQ